MFGLANPTAPSRKIWASMKVRFVGTGNFWRHSNTLGPSRKRVRRTKEGRPAYNPNDFSSVELHFRRISKALRLWFAEEKKVLEEIEYLLHEAGKRL